ncbi:4Fe-4S dicluster domain-containing protein [Desulfurispora thermophila]|uniref:4Fe-4S dicluster domain-containing protein n=1 Tax=Desulfurispora thermophila TaxID=265470 RepID=UPI0003726600|nr:4Fe-4S dicluster domain-containing protein [Desulfurispora thermophila]
MPKVLTAPGMKKCIGCYSCMLACARTTQGSLSPQKAALAIRTVGGLQSRLVADICRACPDAPCAQACRCGALVPRSGGGVKFNPALCLGCRDCVEACIVQVIKFDEVKNRPIVCIQCGTCTRYCPHGVLLMEERA